jgi:hypothetical protein
MAARLTKSQRQKLKQLIVIADIHRYTEAETMHFIRESLGYEITKPTVYKIKREQRQDAISWLSKMRSEKYIAILQNSKDRLKSFRLTKQCFLICFIRLILIF